MGGVEWGKKHLVLVNCNTPTQRIAVLQVMYSINRIHINSTESIYHPFRGYELQKAVNSRLHTTVICYHNKKTLKLIFRSDQNPKHLHTHWARKDNQTTIGTPDPPQRTQSYTTMEINVQSMDNPQVKDITTYPSTKSTSKNMKLNPSFPKLQTPVPDLSTIHLMIQHSINTQTSKNMSYIQTEKWNKTPNIRAIK